MPTRNLSRLVSQLIVVALGVVAGCLGAEEEIRLGWDLNSTGVASSWSGMRTFPGGFRRDHTVGADRALRDIDGNGTLDPLVATVDDPSEDNVVDHAGLPRRRTAAGARWSTWGT
jgi:hypothetical protein